MNVSMTVGDIIVSAVISLIAGVITGIITGYGVTIYYRNKDKKRDAGKYTKELLDFIAGLVKIMTYEGNSVPDYKVIAGYVLSMAGDMFGAADKLKE